MSSGNFEKVERARARQRREEESRQSTLDRAAQESCASLRIADLGNVISDTIKDSERNLIGHVKRMFALLDADRRREKGRIFNLHRRLTELESRLRVLAKPKKG